MTRPLTIGERQKLRTAEQRQASRAKGTETRRKNKLALAQPVKASRSPAEKPSATFSEVLMAMNARQAVTIGRFGDALRSIAANTCCDGCQEAARVARSALGPEQEGQAERLPEPKATHKSFWQRVKEWWRT